MDYKITLDNTLTVSPHGSAEYKSIGEAISAGMPDDYSMGELLHLHQR